MDIDDSASSAHTYTLGAAAEGAPPWQGQVKRDDREAIRYQAIEKVILTTGEENDSITISKSNIDVYLGYFITSGSGEDEIKVGSADNGLDWIRGKLFINGKADNDTLIIDDVASTAVWNKYTLGAAAAGPWQGEVRRIPTAPVSYQAIEKLTLNTRVPALCELLTTR